MFKRVKARTGFAQQVQKPSRIPFFLFHKGIRKVWGFEPAGLSAPAPCAQCFRSFQISPPCQNNQPVPRHTHTQLPFRAAPQEQTKGEKKASRGGKQPAFNPDQLGHSSGAVRGRRREQGREMAARRGAGGVHVCRGKLGVQQGRPRVGFKFKVKSAGSRIRKLRECLPTMQFTLGGCDLEQRRPSVGKLRQGRAVHPFS